MYVIIASHLFTVPVHSYFPMPCAAKNLAQPITFEPSQICLATLIDSPIPISRSLSSHSYVIFIYR